MRILVVRFFDQALIRSFVEDLRKLPDIKIDLLCSCNKKQCSVLHPELYDNIHHINTHLPPLGVLNHWRIKKYIKVQELVYRFRLKRLLRSLPRYDICHIHFLIPKYGDLANIIRGVAKHLILSVWGSDFYKATTEDCLRLEPIIRSADVITFSNELTAADFAIRYPPHPLQSYKIKRFGLEPLDRLQNMEHIPRDFSRKALSLPINAIIVACGTNCSQYQQHEEIIKSLIQVKHSIPESALFIFPMTYGHQPEYREFIKRLLAESGLNYKVLEKYLDNEQIAHLRKVTDILIQVQETDQLSGAMQEHLYAGSVVLTGSWLPYKVFDEEKVFIIKVPNVQSSAETLLDVIDNLSKYKKLSSRNHEKIWRLSSREVTSKEWLRLYQAKNLNHSI